MLRAMRHGTTTTGHPDTATIRAKVLAEFEEYLDARLAELRDGEGIAYLLRIEVLKPVSRGSAWSRAVKARDGHRCQRAGCGATENLHAHHIIPVAMNPDLVDDLDNGVTLCADCHAEAHTVVYDQPHLSGVIRG
jgi:hypothetical protein